MCPFLLGTLRTKKIRVFKGIELGIHIFEIGIVEIKMAKYYLNYYVFRKDIHLCMNQRSTSERCKNHVITL